MKLAEILTGPEAWCQRKLFDGRRWCLIGATQMLCGTTLGFDDVVRLHRVLADAGFDLRGQSIPDWNDAPERTWDDIARVVEAYDRDRMLNP